MTLRMVEAVFDDSHTDTVNAILEEARVTDVQLTSPDEEHRRMLRVLVATDQTQALTDRLQTLLGATERWRIVILPVEATMPAVLPEGSERKRSSREELVEDVAKGTEVSSNYLLLTILSVVVAWVGLTTGNVAVIIGAMVIAPLLGPNLALSVGTALGDTSLIRKAVRANAFGLGLTLGLSALLGVLVAPELTAEIALRTRVAPADLLLALASGAAAALSLTTGLSSALVGVMVAVALMPPAVVAGMMFGGGYPQPAAGALLLLCANVVCLNLASQLVLLWKGVRPRTGLEQRAAKASVRVNVAIWVLLLAFVATLAYFGVGADG